MENLKNLELGVLLKFNQRIIRNTNKNHLSMVEGEEGVIQIQVITMNMIVNQLVAMIRKKEVKLITLMMMTSKIMIARIQ